MILSSQGIAATPTVLEPVEHDLLRQTGGTSVLWCGRAATGLYWGLRAISECLGGTTGSEIILPATNCESVGTASIMAGFVPRIADVDSATGMPTLESIRKRVTGKTRAVLLAHLYGQAAGVAEIAEYCAASGLVLIEDATHALGGRLQGGDPVGSVGDLTLFSFNRTKIIECGGGALLVRRQDLRDALTRAMSTSGPLPATDVERTSLLEQSARNLEHACVSLLRAGVGANVHEMWNRTWAWYHALYLRPLNDPAALAASWPEIPGVVARRFERANEWVRCLENGPWRPVAAWQVSGVCWRLSILVDFPARLCTFTDAIRRKGVLVSNLYWPIHDFFRPTDPCPNAINIGRRVLNLCVDDTVDLDWVRAKAGEMLACAKGGNQTV